MLKENQFAEMRWHSKNKKYYVDKGYMFTKMKDVFKVDVNDLPCGSKAKVAVICDYCGKEITKDYRDYITQHNIYGDACKQCHTLKAKEMLLKEHGVVNVSQLESVKEKRTNTFIKKYGVENPYQSKVVKEKIKHINLQKYGVEHPMYSDEIINRFTQTMKERYGVNNPSQLEFVKDKKKQKSLERYNTEYVLQASEVREKINNTLLKNGNTKVSKAEIKFCNLLKDVYGDENCTPSFPLDRIIMDCKLEVNGCKIDCEFDGSYWHQDTDYDNRRDMFVKSQGYKVLRVKGNYEIPTKEQLKEAIDYLVKGNHGYNEIITDI